MSINKARNASFAKKSLSDLASIAVAGTLGSACAWYHMKKQFKSDDFWKAIEKATKSRQNGATKYVKGLLEAK